MDGIGLLIVIGLISLACLAYSYWEWKVADRRRRADRKLHRNLMREVGR
jgi:hypothetical protein